MRLVQDWKDAWKWHSAQALAALALLPIVWMELPPDVKAFIPEAWQPWIVMGLAFGGLVGRLRDQP